MICKLFPDLVALVIHVAYEQTYGRPQFERWLQNLKDNYKTSTGKMKVQKFALANEQKKKKKHTH